MTHLKFPTHTNRRPAGGAAVLAVIALIASSCGGSSETAALPSTETTATEQTTTQTTTAAGTTGTTDADLMTADDSGVTAVDDGLLTAELAPLPSTTLSDADRDSLVFMREEEKLALDVYHALYETWGLQIFDNIAGAEQTHTDSVKTLLDRWGIADPALDQPAGVFVNADLQALYTELVATGSRSVTDALLVGATIEDLDIDDLQARASDDPAIALVFANLEKGSRNHLRAFVRQLDANGATYTPSYISQADFDAIVTSPTERGRGN